MSSLKLLTQRKLWFGIIKANFILEVGNKITMDKVRKLGKAMNTCLIDIVIMGSSMKVKRMVTEQWYLFLAMVTKMSILGSGIWAVNMVSVNTMMRNKIAITMGNFKIIRNKVRGY